MKHPSLTTVSTQTITIFAAVLVCMTACRTASALTLEWGDQIGSWGPYGYNIDLDGLGNVYLADGVLTGEVPVVAMALLAKYSDDGGEVWQTTYNPGSLLGHEVAAIQAFAGVSADAMGNVFFAGTAGFGEAREGTAYVARFDANGTSDWVRAIADDHLSLAHGIDSDHLGNVYVAGRTEGDLAGMNVGRSDSFITKYGSDGTHLWTRQYGSVGDDSAVEVAVDNLGNVFVVGFEDPATTNPGENVYVRKYRSDGSLDWHKQLGMESSSFVTLDIAVDGLGGVLVGGGTAATSTRDASGPFVTRLDTEGSLQWELQPVGNWGAIFDVSLDGLGAIYIAGTAGPGLNEPLLGKLNLDGNLLWTEHFASTRHAAAQGVRADGHGSVYLSGVATESLFAPYESTQGGWNAFVAKFSDPVPEPTSVMLACIAMPLIASYRAQRKAARNAHC